MKTLRKSPEVYRLGRVLKGEVGGSIRTCMVIAREKTTAVARDGRPIWQYKLEVYRLEVPT